MSGMHARPAPRRDTWTLIRTAARIQVAISRYLAVDDWRKLPARVRALNAAFAGALRSPAPAEAPGQGPRPGDPPQGGACGAVRAGASDADAPVDYWPAYLPAPLISRRASPRAAGGAPAVTPVAGAPEAPATATPPGSAGASPQLRYADPEAAAAPAFPGAARPPWDAAPRPAIPPPRQAWRGAAGRRETLAMAVLRNPVPLYYLAHLAAQDTAVMSA